MKNWNWLKEIIESAVRHWVRPRHLGILLLSFSTTILVALGSGFNFKAKGGAGLVEMVEFSTADGLTGNLLAAVVVVMCVTWVVGLGMVIWSFVGDERERDARRVLVVELRGLVDTSDRPLLGSVPRTVPGRRLDCLVNVRPYLSGRAPQVEEALKEMQHIQRELRQKRGDTSRANVTVVAGGVMQVPLQFYAGTLLDDEGAVQLYEWERTQGGWKALTEADDDGRFAVNGLDGLTGASEVVLAVSASYKASIPDIRATFPGLPVVHMALENPLPNALWSEAKQAALTQQFLQTLAALGNLGVKTIHLVLVAPATLSIRFGKAYDHRNMPELRCYQYESKQFPPYPWSVRMPQDTKPVEYLVTPTPPAFPLAA